MRRAAAIGMVTAATITVGLFTYPDYTQDMLYVSRQTIGALVLAFTTNFVVAIIAGIISRGHRTKTFFRVLLVALAFTLTVFFAVGFWADLYARQD